MPDRAELVTGRDPLLGGPGVIRAGAGTQFDPEMVAAYESVPDEAFVRIRDGVA